MSQTTHPKSTVIITVRCKGQPQSPCGQHEQDRTRHVAGRQHAKDVRVKNKTKTPVYFHLKADVVAWHDYHVEKCRFLDAGEEFVTYASLPNLTAQPRGYYVEFYESKNSWNYNCESFIGKSSPRFDNHRVQLNKTDSGHVIT